MWFALTREFLAVAPMTYAPLARLTAGEERVRVSLGAHFARDPAYSLRDAAHDDVSSLLSGAPFSLTIARSDLYTLEAVEPCPSLRVVFRSGSSPDDRVFDCPHAKMSRSFGDAIEQLFDAVERYGYPTRLERGWLAYPNVAWESADALPEGDPAAGAGAYRSAPKSSSIVARRPPTAGMSTFLVWLTSTPDRPFRQTPKEVVLTSDDIFVRFHGGHIGRLPRSTLVSGRKNSDGDAIYRFGRTISLLLVHREGCPVAEALDRQLEAVEAAAGSSA